MRRRDWILGWGTYSLIVRLGEARGNEPSVPEAPGKPQYFPRIAPPEAERRYEYAPEPHMALVELGCDVVVAGGGLAGVCAALAAARQGAKVILLQDRSRLGGNSSSEVKMHVVGANCHKGRPGWRESGIIEELRLEDAVGNPQRSWELWDLLLYDKVVSEPNITLLLETAVFRAATHNNRITEVLARCDKSETLYRIRAQIFVDATGDSRLGLEAGAELRYGREARSEFQESLAPETADKETLGSSILFTSRRHPRPMPFTAPRWARKITKENLTHRPIRSWEYGYWWIEWGGNQNTIYDNERIRFELLSIVMGVWDYIKNSGAFPDAANWAMDWVGMMPGKRGSRRLVGDYMLTQHDLERGEVEDAVAIGGWAMDDHPPGGFDRSDLPPFTSIRTKEVYSIPYRALYSRNIENLMMAGRNISASHVAFTSTRVMATCAVIGQAVGTAAAQCVRNGFLPRAIWERKEQLALLQQTLLRDDQAIKGVRNQDPADLARKAQVKASAAERDAPPENVINGWLRDIPGKEVNHWAARMSEEGPWLELSWPEAQPVRRLQITFDTGFQRELTLTASDAINAGIIRAPQPETVRDFSVLARRAGASDFVPLLRVEGNYQRLRRFELDPTPVEALRIQIHATNGDPFARIVEVRCYA